MVPRHPQQPEVAMTRNCRLVSWHIIAIARADFESVEGLEHGTRGAASGSVWDHRFARSIRTKQDLFDRLLVFLDKFTRTRKLLSHREDLKATRRQRNPMGLSDLHTIGGNCPGFLF